MIRCLSGTRTCNDRAASSSARQWTLSADTGLGDKCFFIAPQRHVINRAFWHERALNDVGPMLSLGSLIGDLF